MNEKYLKVIEELGALLIEKDRTIQIQSYEISILKKEVKELKQEQTIIDKE